MTDGQLSFNILTETLPSTWALFGTKDWVTLNILS